MTEKKYSITAAPGVSEIIIREGNAPDIVNPEGYNLGGQIGTVREFLTKKKGLNLNECTLFVNEDEKRIWVVVEERNEWAGTISGSFKVSVPITELGINTGKKHDSFQLSLYFRMNRKLFVHNENCLTFISLLQNFQAKVEKEVNDQKDVKGNYNILRQQAVRSNMPETINLRLQPLKGFEFRDYPVEVIVDPTDLRIQLDCPKLKEESEEIVKAAIENEIRAISDLFPDLAVIYV